MSESWLIRLLCLISLVSVTASEPAWSQSTIRTASELAEKLSDLDADTDCAVEFPDLKFECENRVLEIKQKARLDEITEAKKAAEAKAAIERAAKEQQIAAGIGHTFSVKDFTSGMSKDALEEFARVTEGAVFLDEGDYLRPYGFGADKGANKRVPRGSSLVDFNYCGETPTPSDYNASYTSQAKSWLSAELHEKCLDEYGDRSAYTIAGVLLRTAERRLYGGEQRINGVVYERQCSDMALTTDMIDYQELKTSFGWLETTFSKKYGSPTERAHWRLVWDTGRDDSYQSRREWLKLRWGSFGIEGRDSPLIFHIEDCRYSRDNNRQKVNASDI